MCSHAFYMLKIVDGVVRHFETVTFGTAADDFLLSFLSRLRSRSETYVSFFRRRRCRRRRSGGGVVDNTLDYQSRGRKIDPPLLRSFG